MRREVIEIDYAGIVATFEGINDYVVFTVEPPWSNGGHLLRNRPKHVTHVSDVDLREINHHISAENDATLKKDLTTIRSDYDSSRFGTRSTLFLSVVIFEKRRLLQASVVRDA